MDNRNFGSTLIITLLIIFAVWLTYQFGYMCGYEDASKRYGENNMKMDCGYIITAEEINNKSKDIEIVALAEDSLVGGYYWTDNFNSAKKFYSVEDAKNYFNCDLGTIENKYGDFEIRKPYKIQKVMFKFESICN